MPRDASVLSRLMQVIYHLLVLLAHRDVGWSDVEAELARRRGISGLDEKASRTS